ncbi:MAG: biotin--[acetyl-CoA-carboxylase] ligase [Gammaproteobacteria bacterium]|nr:biotin--[acetyl-CoA-carboxylase] ligase [Gammaproteobacteria bacterium]MBL7000380.1 biotin--[acetyl-CoA-carboxylase] ligase [Gammaproteobacteria bacterium]
MAADTPMLDSQRLRAKIASKVNGEPIELYYLPSCASTNIECQQLGQHGSIVLAEQQTAGRGRRGNLWHSVQSNNIYCSIGLHKALDARYLGLLSLQVGICIAQVLREQGFSGVNLKWPNDVLLDGKKLGGILIETRLLAAGSFYLVIGFGLNVILDESTLQAINQPATSLSQYSTMPIDRQLLLGEIISRIINRIMQFDLHRVDALVSEFNQYDSLCGQPVLVKTADQEIPGVHLGIATTGQIQVRTEHGVQLFAAAEISLRGTPTDATD